MVTTAATNAMLVWTFENQGDVIQAENVIVKKFLKEEGRKGFGIAPTTLVTITGAANGSRFRKSRREARPIDMPILIFGTDRQDVEDSMRRFARLLQDDLTTPKLVATYPDGTRVYAYVNYSSGADPTYGSDTNGRTFARWAISLVAMSPYWTEETPTNYYIRSANQGRGLLGGVGAAPGTKSLSRLAVSSSQTIGNIAVENNGDVDVQPVWTLKGPMNADFVATRFDGQTFAYQATILAARTVTIDTVNKTVTDDLGNNLYGSLGTAPQLFAIPKGTTSLSVVVTGTDSTTLITVAFNKQREVIFG